MGFLIQTLIFIGFVLALTCGQQVGIEKERSEVQKKKGDFHDIIGKLMKLMTLIDVPRSERNETIIISVLHDVEYLVHETYNAHFFVAANGLDMIFPLIDHGIHSLNFYYITKAVLSIFDAAMQGNPVVQKYVEVFKLPDLFVEVVEHNYLTLELYIPVLSSYMENESNHIKEFVEAYGLEAMVPILMNHILPLDMRFEVINLLGNMTTYLYHDKEKADLDRRYLMEWFHHRVMESQICERLPYYLSFEELHYQEKIMKTMNAMSHLCTETFQSDKVVLTLRILQFIYTVQYPNLVMDEKVKNNIITELNMLISKTSKREVKEEL